MIVKLDELDLKILKILQEDADRSLDDIAAELSSSRTPIWYRIRKLREMGVIQKQVAILDREKLGLESIFFVLIRTSEHDAAWQDKFLTALSQAPEVIEAHRLAGEIDYILKVIVANARAYDVFYQKMIKTVKLHSVTATLSMEVIKSTTALPLTNAQK